MRASFSPEILQPVEGVNSAPSRDRNEQKIEPAKLIVPTAKPRAIVQQRT